MTKAALKEAYLNGGVISREFGIRGFSDCFISLNGNSNRIRESQYYWIIEDYRIESEFKIIEGGLTKHTYRLKTPKNNI